MSKHALFLAVSLIAPALGTNEAGLAFLKENGAKDGVVTLPSGLQYKALTTSAKAGALTPTASSLCQCHYAGRLIDGTEFDSSIARGTPANFAPNQVIKGWTEAMQLMREGDKWELYIPSELAYGNQSRGKLIKAGDVLIFTLELLKVHAETEHHPAGFVRE
jgi:FKBP-type peptidyl-prolyl cis-trans isomerase FklB